MIRKTFYALIALSVALVGVVGFAGAASAQTYNEVTPGTIVACVLPDGSVDPFSTVTCVVHSDPIVLGTAKANAAGGVNASFPLPSNVPPGNHSVVAQGTKNGKAVVLTVANITVKPASSVLGATQNKAAVGSTLKRTGASNTVPLTIGGATLVLVGAGMVFMVRRRNSAATAAA
jgi:LPXTG-motif cell wall-anchored protein